MKQLVFFVKSLLSHKYIKRTGSKGNYRYWYKTVTGEYISSNKSPELEKQYQERIEDVRKKHFDIRFKKETENIKEEESQKKDIKESKYLKGLKKNKQYNYALNKMTWDNVQQLRRDKIYMNDFIKKNEPFINDTFKYAPTWDTFDDKMQYGRIAMMHAINKVDKKKFKQESFLSYVRYSIVNQIKRKMVEEIKNKRLEKVDDIVNTGMEKEIISQAGHEVIPETHTELTEFKNTIERMRDKIKESIPKGKKKSKEIEKQVLGIWDMIVKGYSKAEAAKELKISKPYVKDLMKKFIQPIFNQYYFKSMNPIWNTFKKFVEEW